MILIGIGLAVLVLVGQIGKGWALLALVLVVLDD